MVAGSIYKMYKSMPTVVLRSIIKTTLNATGKEEQKIQIKSVEREGDVYTATFKLPAGYSSDEFVKVVKYMYEASFAGDVRYKHIRGNLVEVKFGFAKFDDKMAYKVDLIDFERPLAIPLFTPFGTIYIDFGDETSTHLLAGGASRMGKSVFLRLLVTHLMLATDGKIKLYFADNKITDLYMFKDIPQIHDAETEAEANKCLDAAITEIEQRKEKLKKAGDIVDVKEYRKKYPNDPLDSIFVVIDEYARFAENEDIQDKVTFIAETAGYLDVHLIIASQRPDVKDVLKPRIRGNILARLAFSTPDEANSKIILDLPDAAYLGRIRGRAVYSDGFPNKVQVPYIDSDEARQLLLKYVKNGWWKLRHDGERQANHQISEAIPGTEPNPLREIDLPGGSPPTRNSKSRRKKASS
jgi:S-DNA-T family DNA segregation ATPase FtsK/SpoIIIE